jgi:hypothetical protein
MKCLQCGASAIWRKAIGRALIALFVALCLGTPLFAQQTENEQAVWKLETSYWEIVKALDMDRYKDLWHPNFIGWPSTNSQPVHKDHITDWITAHTQKGEKLQWFALQPGAVQSTDNVVVTDFWVTAFWADASGRGEPSTSRITHTWIKTGSGWRIIGGMSTLVPSS